MLTTVLTSLVHQMNDHLRLSYGLSEDIVYLSPPTTDGSNIYPQNRVGVSILNIEKENSGGMQYSRELISASHSQRITATWPTSVYLLIAVIFQQKQYKESVQIMSGVLVFLQRHSTLAVDGESLIFSLEVVNLSFHELSNVWSVCGGDYSPSVVCKLRVLPVVSDQTIDVTTIVGRPDATPSIKNEEQR